MDFDPPVIAGGGAGLFAGANGGFPEYRVSGSKLPMKMEFLPGKINGISEKGSLAEYRRTHVALDGLSGGYDISNRIPFGSEYRFKRTIELGAGWGTVVCDASIIGPGNIMSLEPAEILLSGSWVSCTFVSADGSSEIVEIEGERTFESSQPWRTLIFTDAAGDRFEIGAGDDWWRWALDGEANGSFILAVSPESARLSRKIFDYPEVKPADDEPPVRRKSWRCQWYWAWTPAGFEEQEIPAVTMMSEEESGCCKSSVFQRMFRNNIRKISDSDGILACCRSAFTFCPDAAHLERPGKKELFHFDRCEALKTFIWANKRAAASGAGGFVWRTAGSDLPPAECRMLFPAEGGFYSPAREMGEDV